MAKHNKIDYYPANTLRYNLVAGKLGHGIGQGVISFLIFRGYLK